MVGSFPGCCARAASGHAVAAPPSSVMNARRSHSITSSARSEQFVRHGKTEHPGGREVDDQLEVSRLHDRQIGRPVALEDAAGIAADLAACIGEVSPVAHQPADFAIFTLPECRGKRKPRRQVSELHPPAVEERVGDYEDGIQPFAHQGSEGCVDLGNGAGVDDMDLQPDRARRRIHFFQVGLGAHGIGWIDQHGDTSGRGGQLAQQPQPLCRQLAEEKIDTSCVATRPVEASDQTQLDGIISNTEDER